MQLSDVFLDLGPDAFGQLVRGISMGKLKTYQLFDRMKARARVPKLNAEALHKAAPKLWERLKEKDDDFARDLAQAVLVSHLDMIVEILDSLGMPHEQGFFAKDTDPKTYLTEGWQERVIEQFKPKYPEPLLRFYTAHLNWEVHAGK